MKGIKVKVTVLVLVFIIAAAATYIAVRDRGEGDTSITEMNGAGLPLVYMMTEKGQQYNLLHGYTSQIDEKLIHDAITPLPANRELPVGIMLYGNAVSGISYEIRSLDGETLIERTTLSDFTQDNDKINVTLNIKNLLEKDKEYMLKIIVSDEKNGDVAYYTRVILSGNLKVDSKIKYVLWFNDCTMSDDKLASITAKLETSSKGDNTNLGRVNINSKVSQVGWGNLKPVITSDRWVTITEIKGDRAYMKMNYTVSTEDENEGTCNYNVKEFYRIMNVSDDLTYVYNFDRWMDQEFEADKSIGSKSRIYMGISSTTDIEMKSDADNNYICFVRNNNLWRYSMSDNKYVKVFSFMSDEEDRLRESYDQNDIKILNVDDKGNIVFLVYGYMNRGIHEGNIGISLCVFDSNKDETTEKIFIPRTEPNEVIARDINILSYVNEKNVLYIYEGNTIYSIDFENKEYMVVARDVFADSCMMSGTSHMFVYQQGDSIYNSDIVNILHMDTGETYTIKADNGTKIRALGFIDGNIAYGTAKKEMISSNDNNGVNFPMYKIDIVNNQNSVIRTYQLDDIYITDVEINDSKLDMSRVKADENGNMVPIDKDQLLSNEKPGKAGNKVEMEATDLRQKEAYIMLASSPDTSSSMKILDADIMYNSDSMVYMSEDTETQQLYYVYAYGELFGIFENISDAVNCAATENGVIMDSKPSLLWTTFKDSTYNTKIDKITYSISQNTLVAATQALFDLKGATKSAADIYASGKSMKECLNTAFTGTMDLTGCSSAGIKYIINKGCPVIVKVGTDTYELAYGYGKTTINTIDFTTGTLKTYTQKDFDNITAQYGSVMMTSID